MTEERADLAVQLGTDDVLELAGLRMRLGIADGKCVGQQAFGEAVTPDDVLSATSAGGGEPDFGIADFDQSQVREALQEWSGVADVGGADALDTGGQALFAANPDLLEQVIEAHLIVGDGDRLAGDVAMGEFDAAIHKAADHRGMRDDEDRVSGGVKLPQKIQDNLLVGFVEIAGGLVGENQFRLIDQSARDRHALLFAAGQFGGKMREAVSQTHALQRFGGLRFVGDAVEILGEHDVFERGQIRNQVKLLKDEADGFRAVAREFRFAELADFDAVHEYAPAGGTIQAAEDVDERRLAGA